MEGKYTSVPGYLATKATRAALRMALRTAMLRWTVRSGEEDGYTVVIGCPADLICVLRANLRFLDRQDRTHLRRVIIVLDRPIVGDVKAAVDAATSMTTLPLQWLSFPAWQVRLTQTIRWAWVNSWLSWCLGIDAATTQHVILHDLDALLIDTSFLKSRYEGARSTGARFYGVRKYSGNGLVADDGLATTFELVLDATSVKATFAPIGLFNHVARVNGRTADFDTLLWAEHRMGGVEVHPVPEEHMVHPSQMICQYKMLVERDILLSVNSHNIAMIPVYAALGGESAMMNAVLEQLSSHGGELRLWGRTVPVNTLTSQVVAWQEKQALRAAACVVTDHASLQRYFELMAAACGSNTNQGAGLEQSCA